MPKINLISKKLVNAVAKATNGDVYRFCYCLDTWGLNQENEERDWRRFDEMDYRWRPTHSVLVKKEKVNLLLCLGCECRHITRFHWRKRESGTAELFYVEGGYCTPAEFVEEASKLLNDCVEHFNEMEEC